MKASLVVVFILFLLSNAVFCQDHGYPKDFPELIDAGGSGNGEVIKGFGGDVTKDREGNRAAVRRRPVILIHGNGGSATHSTWGWQQMRSFLKSKGYNDSEIWAVSYLGQKPFFGQLIGAHRDNIEDVRRFIDGVREYLGVEKVDLIGHSLGCGMIRGYLLGLNSSGLYENTNHRFAAVGTAVFLSGAHYGLGKFAMDEFKTGSTFELDSHQFHNISDDTPYGARSTSEMIAPAGTLPRSIPFQKVSSLDDGSARIYLDARDRRIYYVALWAIGDMVDGQLSNTGGLQGADLNKGYQLGSGTQGHEKIIKDSKVFDDFYPYLNK